MCSDWRLSNYIFVKTIQTECILEPQATSFHPLISTLLGGLFIPFKDSLSCVWLQHRERWRGWMLWLLSPFTSGLEVWLSVLLYVNSKFRLLLPFNNNNLDFEALGIWPFHNLSVCVTVVYWLLDYSSSFTEDFHTHVICLFSAPKSLWTLGTSINRLRSQLLNTLVSEAPNFLISSLSIITSVPFYPLVHTIKLWACLSPGNTTLLKFWMQTTHSLTEFPNLQGVEISDCWSSSSFIQSFGPSTFCLSASLPHPIFISFLVHIGL